METLEVLRRLSEALGPPGFEDEVRDAVRDLVTPLVDEVHTDALGNLIAVRRGRREDTLLLDAHMDEVSFLVSHIDEEGFLRIAPLGGWDPRVLPSHAVTVLGGGGRRARGVIGTLPPHVLGEEERKRPPTVEELFVDVGAASAADVAELGIRLGAPCVPRYPFERLNEDLVMGKAFDDRAGCTIALRTLAELGEETPELTLAVTFTIGEEVGLRGAQTAAYQVRPRIALALEGTTAVDVPGVSGPRRVTALGGGPAITIADRTLIANPGVVRLLEDLAAKDGIPHQLKTPLTGGTNAGAIHTTAEGALCGVLSVPCRYIHTPLALLRPSDLENTIRLATAFVREAATLATQG